MINAKSCSNNIGEVVHYEITLLFWLGVAGVYYVVNETPVWQEYGWWLLMMVGGTYFLLMDVKLMLMIMRHEEKKKWKRYRLKNKFEE